MHRASALALLLALSACGASPAPAATTPSPAPAPTCASSRDEAARAADALEACRVTSPRSAWPLAAPFDAVDHAVGAHLGATASETLPLADDAAQSIADQVWALLDAVHDVGAPAPPDAAAAERVEYAAEAVLGVHETEPRALALGELARALAALRVRLEPAPAPSPCDALERSVALAWLDAEAVCAGASPLE